MNILVGYTGFVGSNIYEKGSFNQVFNSKNIQDAYGLNPDLLVYAGVRAEKYLANKEPDKDMEMIRQAQENIKRINPKKVVLISTVDVLNVTNNINEMKTIDTSSLNAYGLNRYRLEQWVRENYKDALIIRLPALFGKNIKKNFLYDYIKKIPFMLNQIKYSQFIERESALSNYYELQTNGFYRCKKLSCDEEIQLNQIFERLGFTALFFTDSRSSYQFYPLERLWDDILTALKNNILLWHAATEPVTAAEVIKYLSGDDFVNELDGTPAEYNFKTLYDKIYGGNNGWIMSKTEVLLKIKEFIDGYISFKN